MNDAHANRIEGIARAPVSGRSIDWTPPRSDPPELVAARRALDARQFADAERHLQRALIRLPDCAKVRTLLGLLHELLGEHHAAYQCYRLAIKLDPRDTVAADGLLRYCHRFGYDPANRAINPAAGSLL